jgi:hypothetical protein
MRTAFLTAALVVGFTGPTFAQPPTPPSGLPGPGGAGGAEETQPGLAMGPGGGGGPMRFMNAERMGFIMGAMRELATGTFFRFKRGDDEVDIHCPSTIALQSCVGAATDLMSSLRRSGSGSGGGGGGSGSGQSGGGSP